jgi:hypothetical protein
LVGSPVYVAGRLHGRYDPSAPFDAIRAATQERLDPDALAVAIDKIPGRLLYVTGLKGWRLGLDAKPDDLRALVEQGARYVVIEDRYAHEVSAAVRAELPPPVIDVDGISVHDLAMAH